MPTIRILHHYAPGYGWSFESPDIAGLTGGTPSYDAAYAEESARFALASEAEERGSQVPDDLIFEHYVPADTARAA